jgi:hypothetical protein
MTARGRADSGPHGSARGRFRGGSASRPVLVGYLVGLALIMIARQLARVTGVESAGGHSPRTSSRSPRALAAISPASAAVAAAVLVFLFVVRAHWPQMPGLLLAMRLASGAVAAGRPNDHGKAVVGQIPAGLLLAWLAGGLQRRRAVTARSLCCDRTVVRPALQSACTFAARSGRAAQFVFSGCKPPW